MRLGTNQTTAELAACIRHNALVAWRNIRNQPCGARRVPPLTAYNAFFLYALAFVFTGAGAGGALLYRPPFDCEPSSAVEYAFDNRGRLPSLAAGLAAGLGMALQFMGSLGGGCACLIYPHVSAARVMRY